MVLNLNYFKKMLISSCDILDENLDSLSEIDSKFGDGDHGVTMGKISKVIRDTVDGWPPIGLKEMLLTLSEEIMDVNGGSPGPLWGSFFEGLSEAIEDQDEIDEDLLKDMLLAALINIQMITKARVGDKTMMDVLIPVVNASRACNGPMIEVLEDIEEAALKGTEDTKNYVAKFGRARFYNEETLGYIDAGAMSLCMFFQGWKRIL